MFELIFLLIAVILFALVALGVANIGRVGLLAAGLFFFALSFLWPHLVLALH
jgi:hypothetical protein